MAAGSGDDPGRAVPVLEDQKGDDSPSILVGSRDTTPRERLRTQLAAVSLLLLRSNRDVAQDDILLASAFELLVEEDLSAYVLWERLHQAWPSSSLTQARVRDTMTTAERLGLCAIARETGHWTITAQGRESVDESKIIADGLRDRFDAQARDLLEQQGFGGTSMAASNIVDTAIEALRLAVCQPLAPTGNVPAASIGQWLRPAEVKIGALRERVAELVPEEDRRQLVLALVMATLDPSSDIGTELLHRLMTGYLLYAFMDRPDKVEAMAAAGELREEVAFLDTPILIRLLEHPRTAASLRAILCSALDAGMRILVLTRTFEELERVLDAFETGDAPTLEEALKDGADRATLAVLSRGSDIARAWLDNTVGEPTFAKWRAATATLRSTLEAIGAEVGVEIDWPADDLTNASLVRKFEALLKEALASRHGYRSPAAVLHDARNLTELRIVRKRNPPNASKVWPGGFLVTPDTYLAGVYAGVVPADALPATLSVQQFVRLIGAYGPAASSEKLAMDAADLVSAEVLLRRASNVSSDVVASLALSVRTQALSRYDVEQLALGLAEELDKVEDVDVGRVAEVMRRRKQAVKEAGHAAARAEDLRAAETRAADRAAQAARLVVEQERRREAEAGRAAAEGVARDLSATAESDRQDRTKKFRRGVAAAVLPVLILAATLVVAGSGNLRGTLLCAIAFVASAAAALEWFRKGLSLLMAALTVAASVASIVGVFPGGVRYFNEPRVSHPTPTSTTTAP